MTKIDTFSNKVLEFNNYLSNINIKLPKEYKLINPYNGINKKQIKTVTNKFYKIYYSDNNPRKIILGSSPARKGSAITGIPFEDVKHVKETTDISFDDFYINKRNTDFLYEVIEKYGGSKKFYSEFYMNFVCPLGIVYTNSKGKEINYNYYDDKNLKNLLLPFIIESLKKQIALGIDTSVAYCIGSGENYKFLTKLNQEYKLFKKIISLEHPRYIMQYNCKDKDKYIKKYLKFLKENNMNSNEPLLEKIDILTETGEFTDNTATQDECHTKGYWHRAVFCLIINDKGEILLQQRSKEKKLWPNKWDVTVGGHVKSGEFGYQALIRELKEELGIKVSNKEIKYILSSISKYNKNGYINNHFDEFYLVIKNIDLDKVKIQKDEVSKVKYFTQKELLRRINNNYEDLTEKTVSWSFVKRIIENNTINEFIDTKK